VILRVVTGRVASGSLDAVVEAYARELVPVARATVGLDRFVVGARPLSDGGHELATMTLWSSVEAAMAAYGGNLDAVQTLDARPHGEILERVDYYELDDDEVRRGPASAAPTRLRLTAGTVARGLDADIQKELRRRFPELPAEVVEAYVGRRVLGSDVEIAFVSIWAAAPRGVALDAPLWPAISDRYDRFRIAVHDVLLEGSGLGGSSDRG
jgi:hypothetical protein